MKKKHMIFRRVIAVSLAAVLLLAGCGKGKDAIDKKAQESIQDAQAPIEVRIEALISQMTDEEKVGQMIQAEQAAVTPEDIKEYYLGAVLSGGGSAPSTGNMATNWQERINELKMAASETRLGIPLMYGIDSVHGNNNIYGATLFPHNIGLGSANDPELMREMGTIVAQETLAIGAQWVYTPCIGNPQNVSWGRSYECFSENAADIGPLVSEYIKGLQGETAEGNYLEQGKLIACAKHFIGEGYTADGVNQGNVEMTVEEFDALLASGVLDPYTHAVDAGVLSVMASYNSVNGVKCHENYHLLTEVLKEGLGFKGLVSGDYNGVAQCSGATYKNQIANAVNAGVDLLMEPIDWKIVYDALLENVKDGSISQERLNDAVHRILYVKFTAGLFDQEIGSEYENELLAQFGSEEHRKVARRAVRESLVLLKNEKVGDANVFDALKDAGLISVVGQKAYDLGSQCGGWTISWQGMQGNQLTEGTTLIQGFAENVSEGTQIKHSVDGSITEGSDAVIAIFGENPYAEMYGDCDAEDVKMCADDEKMMKELKKNVSKLPSDVPVIGIIVAGRPIDISAYEDMFDVIIMAWLPGTEGDGVAEVLFGDYDFSGTLKYTWMKNFKDIGKQDESLVRYPYGHGLNKQGDQL